MPEVTRKLLIVEVPEGYRGDLEDIAGDRRRWIQCSDSRLFPIHELPSTDELGRVARVGFAKIGGIYHPSSVEAMEQGDYWLGQAILDALTKRTEGGDAK